jgi:hypothetical protein
MYKLHIMSYNYNLVIKEITVKQNKQQNHDHLELCNYLSIVEKSPALINKGYICKLNFCKNTVVGFGVYPPNLDRKPLWIRHYSSAIESFLGRLSSSLPVLVAFYLVAYFRKDLITSVHTRAKGQWRISWSIITNDLHRPRIEPGSFDSKSNVLPI